ncbi:hypothetical protein BEN83_03790 [Ligilactobacillus agilis]|nr:hypothetical protein BEN83_03790 [Ligilactobacillus agilis]
MLRKWIILSYLCASWLIMLGYGLFTSNRQVYSEQTLATTQTYGNGTGKIDLTKQVYDAHSQTMLLQFVTTDQTNSSGMGINAKNLHWKLFVKHKSPQIKMTVLPVVDNKITVLINNLASNYEALALDIKNTTPNVDDANVELSQSSSSMSSAKTKKKTSTLPGDAVMFVVANDSKHLSHAKIANTKREQLAKQVIRQEIAQQNKEKQRLQKAIQILKKGIKANKESLKELDSQSQYLTGQDQADNYDSVRELTNDITDKQSQINNTKQNIKVVNQRLRLLNKKLEAVANNQFDYGSKTKTYKLD